MGYGIKIFLPRPLHYVTRSPGCDTNFEWERSRAFYSFHGFWISDMDLKKGLEASAQKTVEAGGEAFSLCHLLFFLEFFSLCVLCIRACCFLRRNPPAFFSFTYLQLNPSLAREVALNVRSQFFLATSAIESSINFLWAGKIGIINLSLAPDHSGRALWRPGLRRT